VDASTDLHERYNQHLLSCQFASPLPAAPTVALWGLINWEPLMIEFIVALKFKKNKYKLFATLNAQCSSSHFWFM
jgi:hypothetical protein